MKLLVGKLFEPRSISCLSCVIIRVKVVLKKTVVGGWRFDYLSVSHLQSQVKISDQSYKYRHLTKTLHLTLKMTTAQVVEMSVTNNSQTVLAQTITQDKQLILLGSLNHYHVDTSNSLSKDFSHPDDHTRQTTDTPGFTEPLPCRHQQQSRLLSPERSHETNNWYSWVHWTIFHVDSNNSLSKDFSHPDDHTRQTTDTPGFTEPFSM